MTGIGAHESTRSKTDEWLTPPEIIADLGPFDLDPCAAIDRPWATAAQHYTRLDNGLIRRWRGRVWLNPPYSIAGRFMARMASHGCGTALIFARTETAWWFKWVWPFAAALLFLEGRVNFHLPDGRRARKNAGAPSVLIAYGEDDALRLSDSRIPGKFVALVLPSFVAVSVPLADVTWREAVIAAFAAVDAQAVPLDQLYRLLAAHPKARRNQHWRAKVRQIVQQDGFLRVAPGIYEVSHGG